MMDENRFQLQLDKHSGQIAKLFSKIDDTNEKIQKMYHMLKRLFFQKQKSRHAEKHRKPYNCPPKAQSLHP